MNFNNGLSTARKVGREEGACVVNSWEECSDHFDNVS